MNIVNFFKKSVIALIIAAVAFAGCKKDDPDKKASYTVTFDSAGGSAAASQTVENGGTATRPEDPTRTGYVFDNWYLGSASAAYSFNTPVTADITLTAKWIEDDGTVEHWNITWNLNGGTWPEGSTPPAKVVKGKTLAEPNAPLKEGSTFEGWYKEATFTNKITFPCTVTADMALYAKWTGEGGNTDPEGTFTSIAALKTWLAAQADNTIETPYKVELKGVNLDENNGWGNLGMAIKGTKFVDLDLGGCTSTTIPDGESRVNSGTITWTGVFLDCENLTAIKLTPNLVTIGENAFRYCEELVSIVLPETLTAINSHAFYTCSKLESVVVPKGVTTISDNAFAECDILFEGLQTIETAAFMNCGMPSITIPKTVTSMGESIFSGCGSTEIDFEVIMKPATPPLFYDYDSYYSYNGSLGLTMNGYVTKYY